jgi:hypothetical protein
VLGAILMVAVVVFRQGLVPSLGQLGGWLRRTAGSRR